MSIRHLFTATAVALGLTFTALAPSAVANEGPDHDHPQCTRGRAFGSWDLPDGGGPGMANGILFRRNGTPALGITAALLPPPAAGMRPQIRGVLHTLARPGQPARPVAHVIGQFGVGDGGHGAYRALFVRMNDDGDPDEMADDGRQVIGGIHGRFFDPRHDPDQADPGPFRGAWVICRRP